MAPTTGAPQLKNKYMANNYCQSSSSLSIPFSKHTKAMEVIARVQAELENGEEGYVGFDVDWIDGDTALWIRDDGENINVDHVVLLVQTLLDELEITEPFVFSWAYTCSKPCVEAFGGGACAVRRGKEPIWCDARNMVETQLEQEKEPEKEAGPIPDAPAAVGKYREMNVKAFAEMLDRAVSCADSAQEINQKVARYCGWIPDGPGWWRHPEKKTACEDWGLPDYVSDLNACHEMEATLRPKGTYACEKWWWYRSNLIDICKVDRSDDFTDHLDATAYQRVRAFLRTMEEPNIDRS